MSLSHPLLSQLQKTPHLDKMNDYTEKQWSKIYIILNKNRSLNTKENIQHKTKAAVKRAIKKRATCFTTLLQTKLNSDVARFTTYVRPCLARNKVVRFVFVGGKTRQHHYSTHFAAMWQNYCYIEVRAQEGHTLHMCNHIETVLDD